MGFYQNFIFQTNKHKIVIRNKIIKRRRKLHRKLMLQAETHNKLFTAMIQNQFILSSVLQDIGNPLHKKRIWMKPRSSHFWDEIVLRQFDENDWIESFRMSKKTFEELCLILTNKLDPKSQILKPRDPLSVKKQVAIALYKLASCAEYRIVGNVFGVHKATVKKCLYRVLNAINGEMMKTYLAMPDEEEAAEIAMNFEKICHIPQLIRCIDGSHIPILAPVDGYRDYVNRKGWPSFNLQAVVDDLCRFRHICIRHPGNTHDAAVFKDSSLFKNHRNMIPQIKKNVDGVEIPYMVVGDPAYPLLPWLLKGFPGSGISPLQDSFNIHLNSARVNVEMAFGRLRGRWRILLKRIDVNFTFVPNITSACCILQNFVESKKEQFNSRWLEDVAESSELFPQPSTRTCREREDMSGAEIRNHLATYLGKHFPLRNRIL